jgi:hypothetical protein
MPHPTWQFNLCLDVGAQSMKSLNASFALCAALVLAMPIAIATAAGQSTAEDAMALSQYKSLNLTKDPSAATTGEYKLDPHHTSVIAKLAHMDCRITPFALIPRVVDLHSIPLAQSLQT